MSNLDHCNYVSEDDVKLILKEYLNGSLKYILKDFSLNNASKNMLGFMSDHWRLKVCIQKEDGQEQTLSFFIKAISRTNQGKATMANDMKLFVKEIHFYSNIIQQIFKQGMLNIYCALDNDCYSHVYNVSLQAYIYVNLFLWQWQRYLKLLCYTWQVNLAHKLMHVAFQPKWCT